MPHKVVDFFMFPIAFDFCAQVRLLQWNWQGIHQPGK